jgi:3-oxoacyl-[acyl-carrier-protein] synthase-1
MSGSPGSDCCNLFYMKVVYKKADNIISSLGITTAGNMAAIYKGVCGISLQKPNHKLIEPFQASVVDSEKLISFFRTFADESRYTRFESLIIASVYEASSTANVDLTSPDTLFIISTTKGNVSLLDPKNANDFGPDRVNLWASAYEIGTFFGNPNSPVIISNACISGVSAILAAKMFLESGRYGHVVVTGGDVISEFIVSGFQSFKALSPTPCRPFDSSRNGLTLGEGAATMILGVAEESDLPENSIVIKSGATSNDANHISGPSRTGEGLYRALTRTIGNGNTENIAFINAHGTATPFNDEMEAIALSRARLEDIPVNSFKGYIGHTLGAAGLIEIAVCSHSLIDKRYIKCLGFNTLGVSENIRVITGTDSFTGTECIKMASGFGGCNAVIHLKKYN